MLRAFRGRLPGAIPSQAVARRLFCFPYAGAGVAVFVRWPEHLTSDIELCIPCLPGRDARVDEPPCTSMPRLVDSMTQQMSDYLDVPYALFGHSMGAFLAFELAHQLANLGRTAAHLFVSAQRGPSLPYAAKPIFHLPDEEFTEAVIARYQNIPERVRREKELMTYLLRVLRADFTLVENYRYRVDRRLECPITAFGGSADPQISSEQLDAWACETTGRFALRILPGGHFFLNDARAELLPLIREELAGY
jgi:surfactin synthase thioesterase subunit